MIRTLLHNDVVFTCPSSDPSTYAKYGATVIASGGTHASDFVKRITSLGVHTTGTVSCLFASQHDIRAVADLAEAVARDIEGNPIAVPWLPVTSFHETHSCFGCINHPVFRAHMRRKVCDAMASDPGGLHIDEYLGSAATAMKQGGCFCDYCNAGFTAYLKKIATPELLDAAKTTTFDDFDYRSFVNNFAVNQEQYAVAMETIPLHREFVDFQLSCASDNVAALGKLACDITGKPVTLSANTCLPALEHTTVIPNCSYCAGEVSHNAIDGAQNLYNAITAYRMAETTGKPLAATATQQDWAFVNAHNAEQLVCVWIALAYACGARFMVPNKVMCSVHSGASQWFCGSSITFAPLFLFVKNHGFLLNDFKAIGPMQTPQKCPQTFDTFAKRNELAEALGEAPIHPLSAGDNAWVFPRVKTDGSAAIHVVNRAYNIQSGKLTPQKDLEVRLPNSLFKRNFSGVTVHGYGSEPMNVSVRNEGDYSVFVLPEVKLWSIVTFEYWA